MDSVVTTIKQTTVDGKHAQLCIQRQLIGIVLRLTLDASHTTTTISTIITTIIIIIIIISSSSSSIIILSHILGLWLMDLYKPELFNRDVTKFEFEFDNVRTCLLYTSPSPRDS